MRPTMRVLPQSYYMLNKTKLPCSVFVTPFAEPVSPISPFHLQHPQEAPIPLLDGTAGLVRCAECSAYMNPFMRFTDGGYHYLCNLCGAENPTPSWYYGTTNSAGVRFDRQDRPELSRGTVEYKVGEEFCTRAAQRPLYAFVIDTTRAAHQSGVFDAVLQALRACIEALRDAPRARVGFCVFDTVVHVIALRVPAGRACDVERTHPRGADDRSRRCLRGD